MNVFQAIGGALGDARRFMERKNYAEMHGVLNSLGTAMQDWLPYNGGHFFNTNLLVDDSVPGRLVFETRTAPTAPRAMAREYRTVVKTADDSGGIVAAAIQIKGPPALPGERAEILGALETAFVEAMSKTLED